MKINAGSLIALWKYGGNKLEEIKYIRVSKKCPYCNWRLFDKVEPSTGCIEMKCPNCKAVVKVSLAFRRVARRSNRYYDPLHMGTRAVMK